MQAEELLRQGRLDDALKALQDAIRRAPADAKLRVFLFQLLAVRGEWERALTQLNVAAELDPANLLMAQVCRPAIACEALRAEIFAGRRSPLLMGEPAEWVGWMVQANVLLAGDKLGPARELRERALEAAPAVPGSIDGRPFQWIADADLGPILEAIVEGRYYWIPFSQIAELRLDAPADLRDVVWAPAKLRFANAGETVALIPTRYPGSESSPDPAVRLARKTEWIERGPDTFVGLGQRLLATDAGEQGLLETRLVSLTPPAGAASPPEPSHG